MNELISNLLMYGKTAEHGVLAALAALEREKAGQGVDRRAQTARLLRCAGTLGTRDRIWF